MQHCLRQLSAWPSFLSIQYTYAALCNWQGHFKVRKIGQEPRGNKARYQASLSFCPSVPGIQPSFFFILSQVSQRYSLASLSFCPSVPGIQPSFFGILSQVSQRYSLVSLSFCPSVPGIQPGFFVILFQRPRDTARLFCHSVPVPQGYSPAPLSFCPNRDTAWLPCHSVPGVPEIQPGFFVILFRCPEETIQSSYFIMLPQCSTDNATLLCHSVPVSHGYSQDFLSFCHSLPGIQPSWFVILTQSPRDKAKILCHSVPVSLGCIQPRLFVILS
jgi:hypothetical protein